MVFAVEVIADSSGEWVGNALTFATVEKASEYAVDLFHRWTLVRDWRVVQVMVSWGGRTNRVEVARKSA